MLEVAGERAEALAEWFQKRWDRPTDRTVSEEIRLYKETWRPPHRAVRKMVDRITERADLLRERNRPLTFEGYEKALHECEEMLSDVPWAVFGPKQSYMRVIRDRGKLLLSEGSWERLEPDQADHPQGRRRGMYFASGSEPPAWIRASPAMATGSPVATRTM